MPKEVDLRHLGLAPDLIVAGVLDSVRESILSTTGHQFVGLYVYGSAVAGGFESDISDVDLIAVLADDPGEELCAALAAMHESLDRRHPDWVGRIEVVYVAGTRLKRLDEGVPRMAVISPGEPFHVVEAGRDWILTWYPARAEGVALAGPPISALIPEIPKNAFLEAVEDRLRDFRGTPAGDIAVGSCAYSVFTICRGLYTLNHGSRTSKLRASEWVAGEYPEWAPLLESAKAWRQRRWSTTTPDADASAATRSFVATMTDRL